MFKQTGVHPELAARREAAGEAMPALPPSDARRAHVFVSLTSAGLKGGEERPVGTLVVEVFDDLAPSAARQFVLRVTGSGEGRAGFVSYEGTLMHKIVDGVKLEGGRPAAGAATGGGVPVEECRRLRHSEPGVVSLSPTSSEFTITVSPLPHLDGVQQVVGRVIRGMDVVNTLAEADVDDVDFSPISQVMVSSCGISSAGGADASGAALEVAAELRVARAAKEAERAARERGETKEETKARLDRESAQLGASLKRSLADGMKSEKNKKAKTMGGGVRKVGGMMDAMLGDISDVADSSDEDDEVS